MATDDSSIFRRKDFLTVIDAMILSARAHTERVTDYNVGSVARTLLEAPALEIDALYQAMVLNLLDAIPIAIYEGFGFSALPAVAAAGFVTFSVVEPVAGAARVIPAGTVLRAPGQATTYQTQAAAVIGIGATSTTVLIACTETGDIGNALSATITAADTGMADLTVTNPEPILGGRGPETAEERRARFVRYIQSLARGTVASLQYAVQQAQITALNGQVIERVERVAVEETPGHVDVWVYNGRGSTSIELVAAAARILEGYWDETTQDWIPGYRPAGMRTDVQAMTEQPVDVSMELDAPTAARTPAVQDRAADAIRAVIRAEAGALLRPAELLDGVLRLPDVDGARLLSPTAAVAILPHVALVPGTITVTWNPEYA